MKPLLILVLTWYFSLPFVYANDGVGVFPPGQATLTGADIVNQYNFDNPNNKYTYVVISEGTLTSLQWTVTGGTYTGSGETIEIKFTNNSSGTVQVTGFADGNVFTRTKNITVRPLPTVAPPKPSLGIQICENTTILRNGTPPAGETWYWRDSNGSTGSSGEQYIAHTDGIYSLRTKNVAGWGPASPGLTVDVYELSVAGTISGAQYAIGTFNEPLTLTGSHGTRRWQHKINGVWSSVGSEATSITPSVTDDITYRVKVRNGICPIVYTAEHEVSVYEAPGIATVTTGANGQKFLSLNTTYASHVWIKDGVDIPSSDNDQYTAWESGDYSVRVTTALGNLSATTDPVHLDIDLIVNPLPVIAVSDGNSGRKVLSAGYPYASFQWTKEGNDIFGAIEQQYTADESGEYAVRVTNSAGNFVATSTSTPVNVAVELVYGMPANPSSIKTTGAISAGIKNTGDLDDTNSRTSISYMDRLGRVVQTVQKQASPAGYDLVQHQEYNLSGSQTKSFLPHVSTGTLGNYDANAAAVQSSFYQTATHIDHDNAPFSEVKVERSPAKRMLESGGVGDGFQIDEFSAKYEHSFNTSSDQVIHWEVDAHGDLILTNRTYHVANQLAAQRIKSPEWTDGDEHTSVVFTNHLGQQVLSRSFLEVEGAVEYLDTYYVYDDYGQVIYVIPPEAVKFSQLPAVEFYDLDKTFTSTQYFPADSAANQEYYIANGKTVYLSSGRDYVKGFVIGRIPDHGVITGYDPVPDMNKLIFKNEYDDKGQLIVKKVPGADPVYYIYDATGRLILSQDGKQRVNNQWTFTKYDYLDRPVLTGVVTDARSHSDLQTYIEGEIIMGKRYESRGNAVHGYTDVVWPKNVDANEYLVVSYYDDYAFIDGSWTGFGHDVANGINNNASLVMPRGLETGGKIRVLGSNQWLRSVKYYDEDLQLIQGISDHHRGFKEKVSTEYNWLGEIVRTRFVHEVDAAKSLTLDERFVYDDQGRLAELYHSTDHEPEVLVASYSYNELGELVEKNLHKQADDTYVQSVDYRYNVRGQLLQINQASGAAFSGETDDHPDRFGMDLYYNSSPTGLTFDTENAANLSGAVWSHSDMAADQRAYGYTYDGANRLTGATYNEKAGGTWGTRANHFNVSDITYDRNGNLKTLSRKHDNTTVDDLEYKYDGNRLWNINDATNNDLGFKDGAESGMEYTFDENGNMTSDANKLITGITYNMLNKPETITFSNGDHIDYTYDAAGTRLKMTVTTGSDSFVTDYSSGLIYEDDKLSLISMPQGRIVVEKVASDYNYDYQYHLTDHLGNVRATVAATQRVYLATMESEDAGVENNLFLNLDASRHQDAVHAKSGDESARLNANRDEMIGPAKALKLYTGDVVDLSVTAKYLSTAASEQATTSVMIFDAIASAYGLSGGGEIFTAFQGQFSAASLVAQSQGEVPAAYLNYIFYDKNYENPQVGFTQVTSSAENAFETLNLSMTAPTDGYLFTYLSNESSLDVDVYFDDFSVTHTSSATVLQADDYYPFGLPISGNKYEEPGNKENRFLYQGKEWQTALALNLYDFHARQYDPAIGQFTSTDPKADVMPYMGTYAGMMSNPVYYTDPDGQCPICIVALVGGVLGGTSNWIANGAEFTWDGLAHFGIGAAVGATASVAAAGTTAALARTSVGALTSGGSTAGFSASIGGSATGGAISGGLNAAFYGGDILESAWSGAVGSAAASLVGQQFTVFKTDSFGDFTSSLTDIVNWDGKNPFFSTMNHMLRTSAYNIGSNIALGKSPFKGFGNDFIGLNNSLLIPAAFDATEFVSSKTGLFNKFLQSNGIDDEKTANEYLKEAKDIGIDSELKPINSSSINFHSNGNVDINGYRPIFINGQITDIAIHSEWNFTLNLDYIHQLYIKK